MKNTIFNYYEFEVNFECNPEKREVSETEIEATSGMTITNIGNRKARPTFEVTGSGTIVLTVGSQTITLTAVSGTFIVDGVLQECYAGTVSKNLNMTGDFPVIEPGEECSISWTGEATILIKPNWRWV